ncbi:MAG: flagellar type III secretion system protein FlhB [Nannocystaceae bacterium]|nr:flagellar type III secretion system protein FlhB [Nannocystaceae bacterium]
MSEDQDQRTHEPTPRRKEQFRKKGDIARSKDLAVLATIAGGIAGGISYAAETGEILSSYARGRWSAIDVPLEPAVYVDAASVIASASAPTAIGAAVGWFVAVAAQLGWPPSLKAPGFNVVKIITFQSAGQVFNPKAAAVRALMATAKVLVVFAAAYLAVKSEFRTVLTAPSDAISLASRLAPATNRMFAYGTLALAILAAVDVWHQKRQMNAKLRMTAEEVKREHKDSEGDPHVRKKRRQRAMEMAKKQRPEIAVRTADVVVVNPTHFAVAIRYDKNQDNAPRVVTKGRDGIALKIREAARKRGIPIVEEPPLARLMYKLDPDGEIVPEKLYHAVAEVLAYVYRLRNRSMA